MSNKIGIVTAINPNKYVTAINVATSRQTIEVDKPCQGLLIQMRGLKHIEVLIDYVDENSNRKNVVRQMPLIAYMSFAQRFMQMAQVHEVPVTDSVTEQPRVEEDPNPDFAKEYVFILPFSVDGSLPLNDKNKYEVTFVNKANNSLQLYYDLYETPYIGYPISVNKQVIRQVDMEKHLDLSTTDVLVLDKFDTILFNTPFGQSDQTIEMMRHLTNIYDQVNDIKEARSYITLQSQQFNQLTLRHSETNDFSVYMVDYIAPTKVLDNLSNVSLVQTRSATPITASDLNVNAQLVK